MCNSCDLQNSKANVMVENVHLAIAFRYQSDAVASAEFHEHIVDELCFDHADCSLLFDPREDHHCFQISILSTDDPQWLANEVIRQVQQAIENWESRPTKFTCA